MTIHLQLGDKTDPIDFFGPTAMRLIKLTEARRSEIDDYINPLHFRIDPELV